jgi:hypothetical protein
MNTQKQNTCPENYLLESFVNNLLTTSSANSIIKDHLINCHKCAAFASELEQFYNIFEEESMLPVSSSIFEKINQIELDRVAITNILLKPEEPLNGHISMAFKAKIVFSTQNFDQENLVDINYIPTESDDILIRVIQSLATQETTFYVFAHKNRLYNQIQLQLDSSKNRYVSDCRGKIKLGRYDIRSLDDKIIIVSIDH